MGALAIWSGEEPLATSVMVLPRWVIVKYFKVFMPISTSSRCWLMAASRFLISALPIFKLVNWVSRSTTLPPAVFKLMGIPTGKLAAWAKFAGIDVIVAPVSIKKGIGTLSIYAVPRKCPCRSAVISRPPEIGIATGSDRSGIKMVGDVGCLAALCFSILSAPCQSPNSINAGIKRYLRLPAFCLAGFWRYSLRLSNWSKSLTFDFDADLCFSPIVISILYAHVVLLSW